MISSSPSCSDYIVKLLGISGDSRASEVTLDKPQLLGGSLECEVFDVSFPSVFTLFLFISFSFHFRASTNTSEHNSTHNYFAL